ncbi:hypothetical protein GJU39_10760 [Pedobacter petrophilus]|uniref:Uncharacterized protein n=1 Tax=Pedobacter petrophilus TaxID=1908241 RepID=A0A7K0FYW8_9SPHI|nr:hypothetical protein [Pedobacter petrophilus]MRX76572.1 hypothetical protein [Pedobacter petrophilus]
MRKSTKIILWIILGILAIILLPDFSMYYQRLKLNFETLPDVYKSCRTIDSVKDDAYEVKEFLSYKPVLQVNDSTIVIVVNDSKETENRSRDEKHIWYKINKQGQITDSLKYFYKDRKQNHSYRTFNGYIVDTENNTYNTWLTNADTTTRAFKNLNENNVFTAKEAVKITAEKELMNAERISSDGNQEQAKFKLIVYKNKVWNYFYTDKDWNGSETYANNKLELKYQSSTAEIDKSPAIIKRAFVKKQEWISRSFWHLEFGWGGGYRGDKWEGTSYFDIMMPKKNLHFQQPVEIYYPDENLIDRITYQIYKPENGAYLLLKNNENARCYLIRPKVNFK